MRVPRGMLRDTVLAVLVGLTVKLALHVTGLDYVDLLVWRAISRAFVEPGLGADPARGERSAVALLIGDEYFGREFKERTPLDRAELGNIVSAIGSPLKSGAGHVVVVDFDVSPLEADVEDAYPDRCKAGSAQCALEEQLIALSASARVILLCPFGGEARRRRTQGQWAEGLVRRAAAARQGGSGPVPGQGIEFASAKVWQQFGAVLTFSENDPGAGARARLQQLAVLRGGDAPPARSCAEIDEADRQGGWRRSGKEMRITADAVGRVLDHVIRDADEARRIVEREAQRPGSKLIFLGGDYAGYGDRFDFASRQQAAGVVVHAAIAVTGKVYPSAFDVAWSMVKMLGLQVLGVAVVIVVGRFLEPSMVRLLTATGRTAGKRLPGSKRLLFWLWGSHAAEDGWVYAEAWARWLVGMFVATGLFVLFLALFAASILVIGEWVDFVLPAIAAWLKVMASMLQGVIRKTAPVPVHGDQAPGHAAGWIWFGVFARATVLLAGLAWVLWSFGSAIEGWI